MSDFCGGIAGVGGGIRRYWIYNEQGQFLSAYGIINKLTVSFNLQSAEDIQNKFNRLYHLCDQGFCTSVEVDELEEKVRTLSNFVMGGNSKTTTVGLTELDIRAKDIDEGKKYKKGQVTTVYRDGKPYKVTHRGSYKVVSPALEKSAREASKKAHTPEAEKKRRKSINARREEKAMTDNK